MHNLCKDNRNVKISFLILCKTDLHKYVSKPLTFMKCLYNEHLLDTFVTINILKGNVYEPNTGQRKHLPRGLCTFRHLGWDIPGPKRDVPYLDPDSVTVYNVEYHTMISVLLICTAFSLLYFPYDIPLNHN